MLNLALKEEEIVIDLEDPQFPGLQIRMRTLTDTEAADLMSGRMRARVKEVEAGDLEEVTMEMPHAKMMKLFRDKVVGFEGEEVLIGGVPFSPSNARHIKSIKLPWKLRAMAQLVQYETMLTKEERGNSSEPDRPSEEDSTPQAAVI